jgi:hypoxanthine phosphoribosyltransferase
VLDPFPIPGDTGEILLSAQQIAERVAELGHQIATDYAGKNPLLVAIMKGSTLFAADLLRAIEAPVEYDVMCVSSYGDDTQSSGVVRIVKDLDVAAADRHVILVEDIIDSGLTMRFLLEHLESQKPASLAACSLLAREGQQAPGVKVDYLGFEIPPSFVVGYGLDARQQYRNLPYLAAYTGP